MALRPVRRRGSHAPASKRQAPPRRRGRGLLRGVRLRPLHHHLHFHHVDPATKAFTMSVASGKSLGKLREEAKKCVLVCANCHGEIESGVIQSPPPGATFART
jgi:hypothetical protein